MKLTVDAEGEGKRLDRYLAERLGEDVSRANVMKYLKEGRARVNGRKTRAGVALAKGDEIDLPNWKGRVGAIRKGSAPGLPEVPRLQKANSDIQVLYEDESMIVVDKPAGLVVHPGKEHTFHLFPCESEWRNRPNHHPMASVALPHRRAGDKR